ncbi:MAG: ATP-binding protein [Eubacterium sp.]|nr:ATP-binding protein [Eubacterium sp.]
MRIIKLPAQLDSIGKATNIMNEMLEEADCSPQVQMQLEIVLDELMSNVARYAYPSKDGDITVSIDVVENPKRVVIILADSGIPYNPLEREDPDITLSAEERKIGGLGIYIVKKYMDEITYTYQDNQNILTLVKRLDTLKPLN